MGEKKKSDDKPMEVAPDAWERFERAVDVVIKAKPKHRPSKERAASKGRVRKGKSRT
jgi:hypothetical protein